LAIDTPSAKTLDGIRVMTLDNVGFKLLRISGVSLLLSEWIKQRIHLSRMSKKHRLEGMVLSCPIFSRWSYIIRYYRLYLIEVVGSIC
jgi:hypothetical protein